MRSKLQQKQVERLITDMAEIIRRYPPAATAFAKAHAILTLPGIGVIDDDQTGPSLFLKQAQELGFVKVISK